MALKTGKTGETGETGETPPKTRNFASLSSGVLVLSLIRVV